MLEGTWHHPGTSGLKEPSNGTKALLQFCGKKKWFQEGGGRVLLSVFSTRSERVLRSRRSIL